ncbi:MAG: pyridoxamine kinase [Oscillospiraceae bacterium]|jgi:pyridoxine kinase|nr:pyridoxamine kinase [Oscillospiraceae bacterium]
MENSTNSSPTIPPHIAAIHDLSGAGKCSLTIALPTLSAMGCEVCALPTAILSTHTGNIPGFTYRDLTEDLPRTAAHWASLGLRFDAIYTGFAASAQQLAAISDAVDMLRGSDTLVLVDPVMGDHGVLYKTYTADMVSAMRRLCAKADIITPNLTEAAMLLNQPYSAEVRTERALSETLESLLSLGPKCALITGIGFDDGQLGVAVSDRSGSGDLFVKRPAIPGVWYGTGDLFASVFLGAMLAGAPVGESAALAVDTTCSAIERTRRNGTDPRFGVHFEPELGNLYQFAAVWRAKLS